MFSVARTIGCFFSLNQRRSGSINNAEKMNIGKNTRCLPGVPKKANAPLAIGKNNSNAAIRHSHPTHSPIPEIIAVLSSLETFLSSAL